MSVFLALMIVGLSGLLAMAFPAFGRHGHIGIIAVRGVGHGLHTGAHIGPTHGAGHALHSAGKTGAGDAGASAPLTRFIPSPRMIFSLLAMYGAFGNAFALHFAKPVAAVLALIPAVLVERFLVTPLWNFMLQAQGAPSSPLEDLVLTEAEAVTPFHNGRGVVAVVRDGRSVQFSAALEASQAGMQVGVGDTLRIEEIDTSREHVTVSVR